MQTSPLLVLVELSVRPNFLPGNSKLSSSDGILESKGPYIKYVGGEAGGILWGSGNI